jgi:dGTPase
VREVIGWRWIQMELGKFSEVAAGPTHQSWETLISRQSGLYQRQGDMRTDFGRDYTRILHCTAYRRLKGKTQVFFATVNDHICTRIEHVTHVASISRTIATQLGLNQELTEAIATGHDLGHPAFWHVGETILSGLELARPTAKFWHEKNGLWFVDRLETLADERGWQSNLDLTYAVRDGIVCHCGEVDEKPITPRDTKLDLHAISKPGEVEAFTWEGCVVKIADKIAYLGRDMRPDSGYEPTRSRPGGSTARLRAV